MSQPKYRATVTVEKITPKRGAVGFGTKEPTPALTEELTHFVISDKELPALKESVTDHLNLAKE